MTMVPVDHISEGTALSVGAGVGAGVLWHRLLAKTKPVLQDLHMWALCSVHVPVAAAPSVQWHTFAAHTRFALAVGAWVTCCVAVHVASTLQCA
jgi:hypothetical protein